MTSDTRAGADQRFHVEHLRGRRRPRVRAGRRTEPFLSQRPARARRSAGVRPPTPTARRSGPRVGTRMSSFRVESLLLGGFVLL
jgi:hypothetical protein